MDSLILMDLCSCTVRHKLQWSLDASAGGAGKRQRVSPQDDAFHFFNRDTADRDPTRKPHLEEAAMALLLLDVHSGPAKVGHPDTSSSLLCFCRGYSQVPLRSHQGERYCRTSAIANTATARHPCCLFRGSAGLGC